MFIKSTLLPQVILSGQLSKEEVIQIMSSVKTTTILVLREQLVDESVLFAIDHLFEFEKANRLEPLWVVLMQKKPFLEKVSAHILDAYFKKDQIISTTFFPGENLNTEEQKLVICLNSALRSYAKTLAQAFLERTKHKLPSQSSEIITATKNPAANKRQKKQVNIPTNSSISLNKQEIQTAFRNENSEKNSEKTSVTPAVVVEGIPIHEQEFLSPITVSTLFKYNYQPTILPSIQVLTSGRSMQSNTNTQQNDEPIFSNTNPINN